MEMEYLCSGVATTPGYGIPRLRGNTEEHVCRFWFAPPAFQHLLSGSDGGAVPIIVGAAPAALLREPDWTRIQSSDGFSFR